MEAAVPAEELEAESVVGHTLMTEGREPSPYVTLKPASLAACGKAKLHLKDYRFTIHSQIARRPIAVCQFDARNPRSLLRADGPSPATYVLSLRGCTPAAATPHCPWLQVDILHTRILSALGLCRRFLVTWPWAGKAASPMGVMERESVA